VSERLRVGVLVSGAGTNLQALLDRVHGHDAEVVAVAASAAGAPALERARTARVPAGAFGLKDFPGRPQRDEAIADWLEDHRVELVVLAGYMHLLGPAFLQRFPGAVINVHPSLLPAFPGLHAIERALAHGAGVYGVTVHFVDEGVDTGPIILQRALELPDARDPEEIHERLRPLEHDLLCEAVSAFAMTYARAIAEGVDSEVSESVRGAGVAGVRVRRALLSVSDKRGIVDFARGLAELGIEIVSTGGTAASLSDAGLSVRTIDDLTGFPEIMDGRVKTLHPRLYAGLLAVRDDPGHMAAVAEHDIELVDLVCVNLYPFERTVSRRGVESVEVLENIDIGGPTMIRAAAKNHPFAAVVVGPESYDAVLAELRDCDAELSASTRRSLAAEAFAYTARYDTAIARWFAEGGEEFPHLYVRAYEKVLDLPYGENPHQRAAYYSQVGDRMHVLSMVSQHHGKQMSFNNLVDLDAARRLVGELDVPACVIVKHNNPCGVAVAATAQDAYERALACDPLSAFGGVIATNRPVDVALAQVLASQFVEVLIAPAYAPEALDVLGQKPNVRLLEDGERRVRREDEPEIKQVMGGLLIQDRDTPGEQRSGMRVVSARAPTEAEWDELLFAWTVCRHVRSNAIVITRDLATVGIGAGQMSRVDSVRLAVQKARVDSLSGAVLASDAFFPFADGPELAVEAGVRAIIAPGGSVRDAEVIAAADAAGVAMVHAGRRHFRH